MTDLRDFPPVEPVEKPERLSQTFLSKFDTCRRSAYLYRKHGGGAGSHAMDRGSAFHLAVAEATRTMIEQDEPSIDPDTAKAELAAVLEDHPELTVPLAEQDRLREMIWHWSVGHSFDPGKVVAVERQLNLELAGATLTGILDLALIDGDVGDVRDYKTSWNIPSQEDFDGSFQVLFYALLLRFGHTEEGECLGDGLNSVNVSERYPRYLRDDGEMQYRERILSLSELHDFKADLERVVRQVGEAFSTWKFPAVPGSHCSRCPAARECPIPDKLRGWHGLVNSPEDAQTAAERWLFQDLDTKATVKELKNWAKSNGPIRIGEDLILDFSYEERRKTDYDGLALAAMSGEPFDPEDFIQKQGSTRFGKRKLTEDEKRAEHDEQLQESFGDVPF